MKAQCQRVVCVLSLLVALFGCPTNSAPNGTLWGAIRWDGFYNSSWTPQDPSFWIAKALQPIPWHDRLPWYSYINSSTGNVTFDANSPSVMDAEISYAVQNGIDHWVFDVYPPSLLMSQSLYSYLNSSSPYKPRLSFALLLQSSWMTQGGINGWPTKVSLYVQHFTRTEYRLVLDNRPLLYLFDFDPNAWGNNPTCPSYSCWWYALSLLTNASLHAGRGRPYIVLQAFDASQGAAWATSINKQGTAPMIHALSAYALPQYATPAGTPWPTFASQSVSFWNELAATGFNVVPPVTAGWDPRPRVQNPPPWDPNPGSAYVQMPTPPQMGSMVEAAIQWTLNEHPTDNPAKVHLLSAWNEYDEGHFIGPVRAEFGGAARLAAIGAVLATGE